MKTALPLLLSWLAISGSGAATAGASPAPAQADPFVLIGSDYKKAQEVPGTFFNPFKIAGAVTDSQKKEGATVTNEAVVEAIGHRGVSGILYGSRGAPGSVIIGDQIFESGDELSFPGDKEEATPLVKGASVVLREIGKDTLGLDLIAEGETARHVIYPLRNFWRP